MKNWILIITILFLQGCSTIYARLSYDFEQFPDITPTVYYDADAVDTATKVKHILPNIITQIENKHPINFKDKKAIKIYVFASKDRYANFSSASPKSRGSAILNTIYISPKILQQIDSLESILTHELVHIHLSQYMGLWRDWAEIPSWFHEGLAVEISNGGGAETVSKQQATVAIQAGQHFIPIENNGIWGRRSASDYDLKPHMFYRQSQLFVRYLMDKDAEAFNTAYVALLDGMAFSDIWFEHYGQPLPELWTEFLGTLKS